MTKIALFPWCKVMIKTRGTCEIMPEQSGFLTGSCFLPWRSPIVAGDTFTTHSELFEESCGSLPLQFTELFNETCGGLTLQHTEGWES